MSESLEEVAFKRGPSFGPYRSFTRVCADVTIEGGAACEQCKVAIPAFMPIMMVELNPPEVRRHSAALAVCFDCGKAIMVKRAEILRAEKSGR